MHPALSSCDECRRSTANLSAPESFPTGRQPGSENPHGAGFGKAGLFSEQSRRRGLMGATGGGANSMAREGFIRRYSGSPIDTVLAPGEYNLPE